MAKRLEIYSVSDKFDEDSEVIASARWNEKENKIDWLTGEKHFINYMMSTFATNYRTGKDHRPEEGEAFFEALGTMCGSYVNSNIIVKE